MMVREMPPIDTGIALRYRIILLYNDYEQYSSFSRYFEDDLDIECFSTVRDILYVLKEGHPADAVVASVENGGWELLQAIRSGSDAANIPIILITRELSATVIHQAKCMKANDIYDENFSEGDLIRRLEFLFMRKWYVTGKAAQKVNSLNVKTPLWKRFIDVALVGSAILLLLPVFLLVALVIRLDSKGPIFYKSKRVGSGYKIFSLYKFRTMRTNADQMIKDMSSMNIYNRSENKTAPASSLCDDCTRKGVKTCEKLLFWDGKEICEKIYNLEKEQKAAFMKFQNDPRITRIGSFLRNTSLDELPQLINILKGDMSLVGNRPLPLYEAEKLTTDDKIVRFAGPAGLTGYWQVMKRSKKKEEISEEERIELDIYYVKNLSFALDMKIILMTFPALFQSETV